ncbi:hypothetical protein ACFU6K_36995 [Kitasatospora sp. NPDC057512]|uniref:hypothetical protein n=1 Tax=Kitasatospora sp. NPDC057512 TaxID=3346154 RepID=UPI00369C9CEB
MWQSGAADGSTEVLADEVRALDWHRGTAAHALGLPAGSRGADHLEAVAVKAHVGRLAGVHLSLVEVGRPHPGWAAPPLQVVRTGDRVTVRSVGDRG